MTKFGIDFDLSAEELDQLMDFCDAKHIKILGFRGKQNEL